MRVVVKKEIHTLVVLAGLWTASSPATQDQNFGLGGTSTGRVSAVTAETQNPFAALYNPAVIPAQPRSLFAFSTALATVGYRPFSQVVVDDPLYRTQTAESRVEDYQLAERSTWLWAIGFTYPFSLPPYLKRKAGLGVTLSGPFSKLRSFEAQTPYDFSSLRYGNSDSQFKGTVSAAFEIWPEHVSFGAGMSVFVTAAGNADAALITDNPTGRMALDIGLNTSPIFGLFGRWAENAVSVVYRHAVQPTFTQSFTGRAQVDRGTTTLDLPVLLTATLYYEPHALEVEWQRHWEGMTVSAGLGYQLWTGYRPAYLVVRATDASHQVRQSKEPPLSFRNTLNPRASLDFPLWRERLHVSAGYQYRPTPVEDLSGPANVMDSDTHIFGLSIRHTIPENPWLPLPLTWSIYGQYHRLTTRDVQKQDAHFIGSPGYAFQGDAYTYGLSVQLQL